MAQNHVVVGAIPTRATMGAKMIQRAKRISDSINKFLGEDFYVSFPFKFLMIGNALLVSSFLVYEFFCGRLRTVCLFTGVPSLIACLVSLYYCPRMKK